jgi:hypothetical protein
MTSVDDGDQTGTSCLKSFFLILPPPVRVQLRDPFSTIKVNREDFRELLNTKWPDRHHQALQQTMNVVLVYLIYFPQHSLICFVERFWQFVEDIVNIA